jgi:hypothetical protein
MLTKSFLLRLCIDFVVDFAAWRAAAGKPRVPGKRLACPGRGRSNATLRDLPVDNRSLGQPSWACFDGVFGALSGSIY